MGLLTGFEGRVVRGIGGGVAVIVAAGMVAGCGNETTQGTATTATTTSSETSGVDVASLDVGNYPTKPQPSLGAAGTEFKGKLADARRMADFVVGPWEIDPGLVEPYAATALVLKSAAALELMGPKAVAEAAGKHAFVNGFFSARQIEGQTVLINAVIRFADDAAASAAAPAMGQAALDEPTSGAARTRVAVPGHDGTLTSSYPFTDPTVGKEQQTVRAYTAHGPYVLMQMANSYDGLDAAVGLVAKTLDMQAPLIDQFKPTPPANFAGLPLDPSGLLARTLLVPEADASVVQNWAYGPRGALHFQTDPVEAAGLFADTGTDVVASGKTTVYQTADAEAATTLSAAMTKQIERGDGTPAAKVEGMPESTCLQTPAVGFYCATTQDRYAIEAQSAQLPDAQQMLAAQYAMLSAS